MDGAPISHDEAAAVHDAADIIYYEAGRDFTYGEGETGDEHTPEEAAAHGADPMLRGAGHGSFQPVRAVSCHQM